MCFSSKDLETLLNLKLYIQLFNHVPVVVTKWNYNIIIRP